MAGAWGWGVGKDEGRVWRVGVRRRRSLYPAMSCSPRAFLAWDGALAAFFPPSLRALNPGLAASASGARVGLRRCSVRPRAWGRGVGWLVGTPSVGRWALIHCPRHFIAVARARPRRRRPLSSLLRSLCKQRDDRPFELPSCLYTWPAADCAEGASRRATFQYSLDFCCSINPRGSCEQRAFFGQGEPRYGIPELLASPSIFISRYAISGRCGLSCAPPPPLLRLSDSRLSHMPCSRTFLRRLRSPPPHLHACNRACSEITRRYFSILGKWHIMGTSILYFFFLSFFLFLFLSRAPWPCCLKESRRLMVT
ncbi:uncharacterized protein K452DRAFT_50471 [Aplosporella prunicola CBS 121167]|uniref:Uncharacterized protein n=1 Tax=Aplosporella prunicola CBS 121167 TaxID=1176127 RepID=A0A6A6B8Y6_9PEZI|nr:uncharacterized protein K452DRAFT_50471 [Aplosporella prunicola CBS 121167]KAF2140722.1 hypothetical protein K452DRAFT_50471 [Aplosporella prunicola CBS 121167]